MIPTRGNKWLMHSCELAGAWVYFAWVNKEKCTGVVLERKVISGGTIYSWQMGDYYYYYILYYFSFWQMGDYVIRGQLAVNGVGSWLRSAGQTIYPQSPILLSSDTAYSFLGGLQDKQLSYPSHGSTIGSIVLGDLTKDLTNSTCQSWGHNFITDFP